MAKDLGDVIGHAVGRVAREAVDSVSSNARKASNGPLSGPKGLAAGAGLVALAPLAAKGAGRLVKQQIANGGSPGKKGKDAAGGGGQEGQGRRRRRREGRRGQEDRSGRRRDGHGQGGRQGDAPRLRRRRRRRR